MKLAVPDLVSNSYFPAIAAVQLGFFADEGLDVALEHIFPVDKAYAALRDGEVEFVGASAHAAISTFPNWQGVKLLCAQAQGMYWFLVLHASIGATRGEIDAIKGLRIGAAPWVDMGLRRLLVEAGIDVKRDQVNIAPVPGAMNPGVNFGVHAAKALEDRIVDGFWANGMGAEIAVRRGIGTLVLDVRRGDGPKAAFGYTMPSIAATERLIRDNRSAAEGAVRAVMKAQKALKQDVSLACRIGENLFPADAAGIIEDLVNRDLPFYDPEISREAISRMVQFQRDLNLLDSAVVYEDIVAGSFENGTYRLSN